MNKSEAFDFLCRIAEGISKMFGSYCETAVQEVSEDGIKTIAIYNGHVSGREVGSTKSIFGDDIDATSFMASKLSSDNTNQLVQLSNGKIVKSSSYFLRGDDHAYVLAINYDTSIMRQLENFASDFNKSDAILLHTLQGIDDTSLSSVFESAMEVVNKPIHKMKKQDRLFLIQLLEERKYFSLRKSIPYLSKMLGVSMYTIYKDLKELGLK